MTKKAGARNGGHKDKLLEVCAAVVVQDGKIMACTRPDGKTMANHLEFPGGKREGKEKFSQALVRELKEELGVKAKCGPEILVLSNQKIELHFFACQIFGTPRGLEGQKIVWGTQKELEAMPFCELDAIALRQIDWKGLQELQQEKDAAKAQNPAA